VNTDYFIRGGFWVFINTAVSSCFSLLLAILFARLVTKDVYGQYKFVLAVLGLMTVVSLPGMSQAIIQSIARGHLTSFKVGIEARLKWSLLGSATLIGLSGYFFFIRLEAFWSLILLAAVLFPLWSSFESIHAWYVGRQAFKQLTIYRTILVAIPAIFISVSLLVYPNVFILVFANITSVTVLNTLFFMKIRKQITNTQRDKKFLRYGKHLSAMKLLSSVAFYLDKLLLAYFLGFAEVATYTIASTLPEQLKKLVKLADPLMIPKLSATPAKRARRKIQRHSMLLFGITVLMLLILIFITPHIIKLFFSERYIESIPYMQVLFASFLFVGPARVYQNLLIAKKKIRSLYHINAFYAGSLIFFLLILTPTWHVWGVVVATVLSRISSQLLIIYVAMK